MATIMFKQQERDRKLFLSSCNALACVVHYTYLVVK